MSPTLTALHTEVLPVSPTPPSTYLSIQTTCECAKATQVMGITVNCLFTGYQARENDFVESKSPTRARALSESGSGGLRRSIFAAVAHGDRATLPHGDRSRALQGCVSRKST